MAVKLDRQPITDEQRLKLARLNGCRFLPGSWDKRFVRDVGGAMTNATIAGEPFEITAGQAEWIDKLYHRYRRQITGKA